MRNKEFVLQVGISAAIVAVASAALCFYSIPAGLCAFALGAAAGAIFAFFTMKRYKRIAEINEYLSKVVRGDYSMNISENEEGELSILGNNIFKVVSQLRSMNEQITNDKVTLADSLADISHQLKTPLTAICVSTDILENQIEDENALRFVKIIEDESEKMSWLIKTLLKLSKLDAGTIEMNFSENSLARIVGESLSPFAVSLDLKDITLNTSVVDATLLCDRNWLSEAVQNIVKNALEHTPEGGTITVTTAETPLFCEITVSDTGTGIPADELPHIFERFYKCSGAGSESVGIGLALSKEIISKHRGSIDVKSEEGSGTSFSIKLYKVAAI